MDQATRAQNDSQSGNQSQDGAQEPGGLLRTLRGLGYAQQQEAVRPQGAEQAPDAGQTPAVEPGAPAGGQEQAVDLAQADYRNADFPGIFLVGWTQSQVDELVRGLSGFAGIRAQWDPTTKLLVYLGPDEAKIQVRQAEGRWSQGMHDAWADAIGRSPRHSVVIGAQEGDTDDVRGGYAIPANSVMVLDMMDIGTFAGETTRAEQSFNLYWVMTHELLGHFYLGLGHGEDYESYDVSTYSYEDDETLQVMNDWRTDLGLPIRLMHPPRVEGQTRTYIFVDAYPGQPDIDLDATAPDPNVSLPPVAERQQRFEELRARMAGNLSRPEGTDIQYYPEVHMVDDDSDAQGNNLPGRGEVLPLLRWGSHGDRVRLAQEKLNEDGAELGVDGIFGRLTYKATVAHQKAYGLQVDGLIGPETWSSLLGYQVATQADIDARRAGVR